MLNDVQKFRFYAHKVLPLVYDDSLSYYEFLCKVVAKLNEVIELADRQNMAIEEVIQAEEDFEASVNERYDEFTTHIDETIDAFEREIREEVADFEGDITTQQNQFEYNMGNRQASFEEDMIARFSDFLEDYQRSFGIEDRFGNSRIDAISQRAVSQLVDFEENNNLLNPETDIDGYFVGSNGVLQATTSGIRTTTYIPVSAGNELHFQYDYNGVRYDSDNNTVDITPFAFIAGYSEIGVFVTGSYVTGAKKYTVPTGCTLVRISYPDIMLASPYENVSLIMGDGTVTPYVPYGDQNVTIKNEVLPPELINKIVQFKEDAPSTGYDFNTLLKNGIWTVRSSRVSACTNIPIGTQGDLKIVVQEMNTNVSWQRVFDGKGGEWNRTINSSTGVPITDWILHISQTVGEDTTIPMSQKAITDELATKVGYEQFLLTYIDGERTIQNKTLTIKSGTNVAQNANNNYITYKYEINGVTKFRVTGKVKGSSNYMFITATATNGFVERQIAGTSTETMYTNQEYTVNNPNVKYVYICLFATGEADIALESVQIQTVKSQYDNEQDTKIEKIATYGNRFIGKKIVCFGDSRTWYDGHEYTNKTKTEIQGEICIGYQQQLRNILGATVDNQGVSGETSAEICTRIRAFDFTNYDAVLLEGGVNDFVKSGEVTIGEIAPIGSTFDTTTVYGAWQSAIEYICANYPLVKIYMDIPAIAWLGTNDDVYPYNVAKIKGEIAELYNLPCKDLYKTSGINKVNRDTFYCDDTTLTNNWHLHFNDAGNSLIGAELAMFINDN